MNGTPKLTIGIPHLNRSDLLHRAIDSCLRQTVPVHVIVADQGKTEKTAEVMGRYEGHPHVQHLESPAKCLWENWDFVARACDTPYFAWLQDDDIIARRFARRVQGCFELFPAALHWQARVYCGLDEHHIMPQRGCFPWVTLDLLDDKPEQWPGQFLPPSVYVAAWALSPGVAFRCGEQFNKALDFMPADADLMAERTILALMGMQGPWVADPAVAGVWIQHAHNERYNQWPDQERQRKVTVEHLDEIMDATDWKPYFHDWCVFMSVDEVSGWIKNFPCLESRHADALIEVMKESLVGRAEIAIPDGAALGNGQATADVGELVWT